MRSCPKLICEKLEGKEIKFAEGVNASTDSFYSSQGRTTDDWHDNNETLINELLEKHHDLISFEMETFNILHLGHCGKKEFHGSAACIILAQRDSGEFLDHNRKKLLEKNAGGAVLHALVDFPLPEEELMHGPECVWNTM